MKKRMILVMVISFLFQINNVYAGTSASINVSTSNTVVGNSGKATLTITSDDVLGQIYGTFSCGGLGNQDLNYVNLNGDTAKSKSYTINWTAKSAGSYTCSVSGLQVGTLSRPEDGVYSVNVSAKTINVLSSSSNKPSSGGNSSGSSSNKGSGTTANKKEYSSDNSLKSLNIEGYDLNPKFNKDTTEYKLTVDQSIEKINISASTTDTKASVSGTGEVSLSSGENTIEVRVTAENGNEKVYKIVVTVEDLNPIKVKINKEEFVIVKKNNDLIAKLEHYEEQTIKIDEQDVVAYVNPTTKVTLVLLKDKDNKVDYYIYNEKSNTYEKYRYINVNDLILQLLDTNQKLEHYKKYSLKLQEQTIDFYKLKKSHKVGLIYGTNIKTGNTSYYIYDQNEETLSKYYDDEIKIYQDEVKTLKSYLMVFMGVVSLGIIIVIIVSLILSKKKRKRKYSY